MDVTLPPELTQLVEQQIAKGAYQTPVEVLLAGVRLLDDTSQNCADSDLAFGELDENLNFLPRTEADMVQQSLEVLANYQQDAIPHHQVEAWVDSLGTDNERPCPQ
jgi:Arc/MetJ-type ribon-helix-helix transcriptional regulator